MTDISALVQGVDPEYNTYNGDISSETVTGWPILLKMVLNPPTRRK